MTNEVLYDPKVHRRSRRRRTVHRVRHERRRYDPRPHYVRHHIREKASKSDLFDNLLVFAGAAADSYITTKGIAGHDLSIGASVPSASGTSVNVPYSELAGIAGGVVLPLVSKKKLSRYLGKVLTGMGANGIAKIADPPMGHEPKSVANENTWEAPTCL